MNADVITFSAFGIALLAFGFWARGRLDRLIDDVNDPDEREYRRNVMGRGMVTMFVAGTGFLLLALLLAIRDATN